MGNREVVIATTTHPFAITMYFALILLGLGHFIGLMADDGVEALLGNVGFALWQTAHLIAPWLMAVGAFAARREVVPIYSLTTEMVGGFTFALTKSFVLITLHQRYGFDGALMTQLLMAGVICACFARASVIARELRAIRKESERRPSLEDTLPRGE